GSGDSVVFTMAYGGTPAGADNATLSPLKTLTPNTGTLTSSNDNVCIALSILTNSLTVGTTYHGSIRASSPTADEGLYYFRFTVISGCTAPVVTTNASNQTVCAGATATFIAAANGSPAPTVQWQVSTGGSFTDVPAATSTTLSFTAAGTDNGKQYRA